MRLSKIKLAGFKSFVDPTTIHFPSNLIGIVGPNGCGKSNVIDAVRWVMGESSARQLRGDSMTDVIFSGSSSRKPVGTATVELIFDNADGTVGGQYAGYNEISVKRTVGRDALSTYFLNGARCRRRDITDLFLGTGLGPRSYSIIEQGMISQVVESRPEDLRVYLEEAAGISKYKERRRETENRIRHTRENLERLSDLREEVGKQLDKLKRQARAAERYQKFKDEARRRNAELLALTWRQHESERGVRERAHAEHQIQVEKAVAALREVEAKIEDARADQSTASDEASAIQKDLYEVGSEIARLEQTIQHAKDIRTQRIREQRELDDTTRTIQEQLSLDQVQQEDLRQRLAQLEPQLAAAREKESRMLDALAAAEQGVEDWRARWDDFSERSGEQSRSVEVERTRIDHIDRQLNANLDRLKGLDEEQGEVDVSALVTELETLEAQSVQVTQRHDELQRRFDEARDAARTLGQRLRAQQDTLRTTQEDRARQAARLESLEALQAGALKTEHSELTDWLTTNSLGDAPRVLQTLDVDRGWEPAVEVALGALLEGVMTSALQESVRALSKLSSGSVTLVTDDAVAEPFDEKSLASRVRGPAAILNALADVRVADSVDEALRVAETLKPHQRVVTTSGEMFGSGWACAARAGVDEQGMLSREQDIHGLRDSLELLTQREKELGSAVAELLERFESAEQERDDLQTDLHLSARRRAEVRGQVESKRGRIQGIEDRAVRLREEAAQLRTQISEDETSVRAARGTLESSIAEMATLEQRRAALAAERDRCQQIRDEARRGSREAQERAQQLAVEVESARATLTSVDEALARMASQLESATRKSKDITEQLAAVSAPMDDYDRDLKALLDRRLDVEKRHTAALALADEASARVRRFEDDRTSCDERVSQRREAMESAKVAVAEFRVKAQTVEEQLAKTDFEVESLLAELEEDATPERWEELLETLQRKITRLEPVNLAAIQEHEEQSERLVYLDTQNADLEQALETLENAIRKIDRQTRTRFKETFDQVNAGVQDLFPKLFGGGHAFLELTGDDLLTTGVALMARPPGKRVTNIHLLSGGEKALTAVALVFSIFMLNPAPFCLLDEVDAPLDDANVGRFSDLVRTMSEHVQFVVVSHNKLTMEVTHQLVGVTMREAGVSRLVSVDIEEAEQMAAG